MKSVSLVLILLVQGFFFGCSKTDTQEIPSKVALEEYILKDIIASVGEAEKLMAFNLGLYGNQGISKDLINSNDLLRNILLSHLGDLSEKDLKDAKTVSQKLKPSFNKFFNGSRISEVKILSLREL